MTHVSSIRTTDPATGPGPTLDGQPERTATPPVGIDGDPSRGPADLPDDLVYCRGCGQGKPRSERVGFRCKQCAAKAKNSPNRWLFDSAGNVISKGKQKCK